ncbi:MAG: hypothetical protein ACK524_17960 [Planctomyces sp.]|jgi:hypothetical protein
MTFADLLHHLHPLFHQNESGVDPSIHGTFSAQKLMAVWKELLKEYDTVMVNFTKSGNHDSSFTKAAMSSLKNVGDNNRESISLDSLNDDDLDVGDDDEFGMESGGWCCFTNSLPILYLRMWLNEKPDLTHFVSRQIPQDVQLDTSNAMASKKRRASDTSSQCKSNKSQKKSPNEAVAEALIGYIQTKEAEAVNPRNMTETLGAELQTFMRAQSTMEKIDLLEKQISVVTKRVEQSKTEEQRQRYSAALEKLESEIMKGLHQAVECLTLICAFNSISHSNQKQWVHVTSVNLIDIRREEQVPLSSHY